jgi:transposase
MPAPFALPPLDVAALAALHERHRGCRDPETRLRYRMVLLAAQGHPPRAIAPLVGRSHDTVRRTLQRYAAGGLDAVPRRVAPGRLRTITPAWEAALARALGREPREAGVDGGRWTTRALAEYLATTTGIAVNPETVRRCLHDAGYVFTGAGWTARCEATD